MAGLEIVIGTYEEYTLGFKVDNLKTDTSVQCLKQIFACHNHTSSIRSLASFEHYLASGGADDRICLIDLKERSEFNQLMGHDGTINSLAFTPDGKFLLSCGSDGKMIATNTATWITHKTWQKAHKGSVDYISIHPDGQMALTIGSDMNLKTWNMVDGRQVFVVNLKKQEIHGGSIFIVEWSPDGDHFALVGNKGVVVLSVNTTLPVKTIKTEVKPTSFCWIDNEFLAVGLDDGHFIYSSIHSNVEDQIKMEKCRIKAISSYNNYLATATSAGDVSLWLLGNDTVDQVCTTNIGCRPICLLIVDAAKYDMEYEVKEEEAKDEQTNLKKIQSVGTVVIENDDEQNHDKDIEEVEKAKKAEKEVEIKDQDSEGINKTEDNEDQIMETPMKKNKKHKKKDKKLDFIEVAGEIAKNDKEESIVEEQKEEIKNQDIESMNKIEDNEDQIMETPMKKDKKHKKKDKKLDFIEVDGEIAENDDQIKKSAKKSSKKKKNAFIEEDLNGDDEEIPNTDKKSTKRKAKPTDFIEEDIGEEVLSESQAKKKKVPEKTPKKKKIAREIEFLVEDQDDLLSKSMDEKPSKKAHKNKKHNKTLA